MEFLPRMIRWVRGEYKGKKRKRIRGGGYALIMLVVCIFEDLMGI